ncbi:MAG: gliding motility-associated C-terminal domain-containing protein [Bacteroidota bacterium]
MRKLLLPLILFLSLLAIDAYGTHNRAGEITYEQLGPLTFRATITTYTKTSSVPADRDSLTLCWGDGSCEWVLRVNGAPGSNGVPQGEPLPNNIKFNQYIAVHTYPARATYTMSMTDPNRNGDILNVNPPNSDQIPFHLFTKLFILNPQFQGTNDTPVLLQPPIDNGNVGEPFIHNPNATDSEGDSLAYRQIIPLMDTNTIVDPYFYPEEIIPGPDNQTFLNQFTGEFSWLVPQKKGEYNVAFLIEEYRNQQLISCVVRDMQITILEEDNRPPTLETIQEICVVAGDTVEFDVIADDPDDGQLVQLSTTGGPYNEPISPAQFLAPPGFQPPPITGTFFWATDCDHIQDQYYQVVFKAEDNYKDSLGLSTQRTVRIKVIAPPPENPEAVAGSGEVTINWDAPYACENLGERFRGFSVWRKECEDNFDPDSCQTGLAGSGYTLIAEDILDLESSGDSYFYIDPDVERGRCYCYRLLANLAEINDVGFPFNFVESLASEPVCVQLARDLPLITNVDVEETDIGTGEIFVQWSKPNPEDLDTIQNAGPYVYKVYRSEGLTFAPPGQLAYTTVANEFWQANDTNFVDQDLNTLQRPYSYNVAFLVGLDDSLGITNDASSVFLTVNSSDMVNNLSWEENVPWTNTDYVVFRFEESSMMFESLDTVQVQAYSDEGLINGQEYCYYIESIGTMGVPGIIDPILNKSQETCGTPRDTIPPCPPELEVTNNCDTADESTPVENFFNDLSWTNPNLTCASDVEQYNIYYAATPSASFGLIETIPTADITTYQHQPGLTVAGCYSVTAVDSVGNESIFSNVVCVDNCPIYTLPNVFTPNGDDANELFIPFPYRFIARIEMKIFNRWGQLVFQTEDPDINWDGTNIGGNPLEEGVYFYTAEVFEDRVDGISRRPEPLSGYIHLIRGR